MTETVPEPMTRAQVTARLEEIAPWPDGQVTARALARRVAVTAIMRNHRHLTPFAFASDDASRRAERESVTALCAEFATVHLLTALIAADPVKADELAGQVCAAWEDGGEVGEWLWEHAQALGADPREAQRLEDALQAIGAREAAAGGKTDTERTAS